MHMEKGEVGEGMVEVYRYENFGITYMISDMEFVVFLRWGVITVITYWITSTVLQKGTCVRGRSR